MPDTPDNHGYGYLGDGVTGRTGDPDDVVGHYPELRDAVAERVSPTMPDTPDIAPLTAAEIEGERKRLAELRRLDMPDALDERWLATLDALTAAVEDCTVDGEGYPDVSGSFIDKARFLAILRGEQ